MKMSSEQFADLMLEESISKTDTANRLDQVATMVADMEKNLTEKIDQANKALVDHLERASESVPEAPTMSDDAIEASEVTTESVDINEKGE